jgi:hypothetical protein
MMQELSCFRNGYSPLIGMIVIVMDGQGARSINFLRAPRIELTKIDPHRSSRQPL